MNKKVLGATIYLLWFFIFGFCVLKVFFPQELLFIVQNERIIQIGKYIDSEPVISMAVDILIGLLTYHFYLCACKRCWRLESWQYSAIVLYIIVMEFAYSHNNMLGLILDLSALISFPILLKCNYGQSVPIFIIHHAGQLLLLYIRSEPLYLADTNYITWLLLALDGYAWLLLYYLYSNFHKEKTIWENLVGSFSEISQRLSSKKNSKE